MAFVETRRYLSGNWPERKVEGENDLKFCKKGDPLPLLLWSLEGGDSFDYVSLTLFIGRINPAIQIEFVVRMQRKGSFLNSG